MSIRSRDRLLVAVALAVVFSLTGCGPASESESPTAERGPDDSRPPGAVWEGDAFAFHEIKEGIYHAIGTGNLTVGCNGSIIINEEDVLLVDSHMTPAAAWALLEELRNLTPKPVRYVVNTHFHFDHAHGNQVYGDDVEIIGHEYTRERLAAGDSKRGRAWDSFVGTLPETISKTESDLAQAESGDDPEKASELRRRLEIQEHYRDATEAVVPTPPNVSFTRKLTIQRGGREIQLLFFGRGHTGGDVVVYLPQERVLATGDLFGARPGYQGDAYLNEWADTLEHLKALDFDVVLPGHGEAFDGKSKIDAYQAYLRDLWSAIVEKHEAGVSAEEASRTIDMTHHASAFPNIDAAGVNPHAVQRVYALLEGTEQ